MRKVLKLASVSPMIEAFNQQNIQLLQNLGYEVHVAANFQETDAVMQEKADSFKEALKNKGIKVLDIPFERNPLNTENIKAYRMLKRILHQEKYDLIHLHSPIGGVLGRLAARRERIKGTKVIYTAHGFHFFQGAPLKNWLLYYTVEKALSGLTDCLITINPEDYAQAHQRKFRSKKIEQLNGVGIDLNKFSLTNEQRRKQLRQKHGYEESEKIMVYVGELSDRKNQALAIRMMRSVVEFIPEAKLLLAGDGDKKEEYRTLIKEWGLQNHVELLGFRSDVPELMALSDFAISTSKQEGLPVNVMEAMGTGLPLVVTNCRGNRDLVQDGENGYVIEEMDETIFAERVIDLLLSDDLRANFGKASTQLIQKYAHEEVDQKMQQIYESYTKQDPQVSPHTILSAAPPNEHPSID